MVKYEIFISTVPCVLPVPLLLLDESGTTVELHYVPGTEYGGTKMLTLSCTNKQGHMANIDLKSLIYAAVKEVGNSYTIKRLCSASNIVVEQQFTGIKYLSDIIYRR